MYRAYECGSISVSKQGNNQGCVGEMWISFCWIIFCKASQATQCHIFELWAANVNSKFCCALKVCMYKQADLRKNMQSWKHAK